MGLDMYAYKVRKPSLDPSKVYARQELQREYVVLPPDEATSELYQQVTPYAQKLRVTCRYYDLEKIREDFNMPDAEIWMVSSEGIGIGGKVNGIETTRKISTEQITACYIVVREEECLVFAAESVAYWRKEYDLQELICDSLGGNVQDIGFYQLDKQTVDRINQYSADHCPTEFIEWVEPTETSALFYHEWY